MFMITLGPRTRDLVAVGYFAYGKVLQSPIRFKAWNAARCEASFHPWHRRCPIKSSVPHPVQITQSQEFSSVSLGLRIEALSNSLSVGKCAVPGIQRRRIFTSPLSTSARQHSRYPKSLFTSNGWSWMNIWQHARASLLASVFLATILCVFAALRW